MTSASMTDPGESSVPNGNMEGEEVVEICHMISCTWLVKEVRSALKKGVDHRIQSPVFSSDKEGVHKWYISIFPNGKGQEAEGYVSLFLRLVAAPTDISVKFILNLKTAEDTTIVSKKLTAVFPPGGLAWGWYNFMPRIQLEQLLDADEIKIQALIKMEMQNHTCEPKFPKEIGNLLDNPLFSDVVLTVQETKIPAHRSILAFRSEVFGDMFNDQKLTGKNKYIKIPDLSLSTAMKMVRFMYTSRVDIQDVNEAAELIKAATKYALEDLKSICFEYLTLNLNLSNVIAILRIADDYGQSELSTYALEYMYDHSSAIFANDDLYELLYDKPNLLKGIVTRLIKNNSSK